ATDKTFDFGKYGSLFYDVRLSGTGYLGKSATAVATNCTTSNPGTPGSSAANTPWPTAVSDCGGNPLPKGSLSFLIAVEYAMAFHRPLVIGADVFNEWLWYQFNPQGGQPAQQVYGYEFFIRYELPRYKDLKVDLSLAYAQGDPTLGYTS